jgi:glycosyltransferase involved in cell wall biosynthesis
MNPKISILIPVYKRLELLKDALESAIQQTYINTEIIVVLNPSVPEIDMEIEHYVHVRSMEVPSISFYKNEVNIGMAGNWNCCIAKATGEYSFILADDDTLMPFAIERFVENIQTDTDVVFSNHYVINETGAIVKDYEVYTHIYKRDKLSTGKVENPEKVIWENSIPITASLIRTSLLQKIQFSVQLNTPEIVFFLKANLQQANFYFVNEYLTCYRVHGTSTTSAGLNHHLLFEELKNIPVSSVNVSYKNAFVSGIATPAISRYLKFGNKKEAWAIFKSKYNLCKLVKVKTALQLALFLLPSKVIKAVMK